MNDSPNDSPSVRDDDQARAEALFRFRVIAPLQGASAEQSLRERVAERAAERHPHPSGQDLTVTARTLWRWLRLHRAGGFEALHPRHRKDKGVVKAVAADVLARAEALRREVPQRWTSTLVDILVQEGKLTTLAAPHRSTVDRQLRRRGASRRQLRVLGEKRTIKMQFPDFGDLWVGDYHHGPRVLAPDGRLVVAKLGAFIDHTTRFPVEDRWYLDETFATLRDTLLRALLKWGPPKVAYTDRGAVYRAEALAYSLAALGSKLVHSRPYYSQGRGVIERWWQLADQFQAEVEALGEPITIHELGRLWEAFRTRRYLDVEHSALGITPAQAVASVTPHPIDPGVARELFLIGQKRTVHKKDGCVSVEGIRFLCDSSLRDREVTVRYDPNDLSDVLIIVDGKRFGRAKPQPIGRPPGPETAPEGAALPRSDYLALIRADYDRRLLDHVRPVAYADLGTVDPGFDESRFLTLVADLSGTALRGSLAEEAHAFWNTFGPIPENLVRIALEQAVRLRGTGRHVGVYLNVLRTFVLERLKSPAHPAHPVPKDPSR